MGISKCQLTMTPKKARPKKSTAAINIQRMILTELGATGIAASRTGAERGEVLGIG